MSGDTTKLKALFRALFDENEGTRSNAATKLYRHMVANSTHPDDIVVERRGESHERSNRIITAHAELIEKLQRQLNFYERHGDPKVQALAAKASLIENRWAEIQEIAARRFPGGLVRGWKTRVMTMLSINKKRMLAWERGLSHIPDSAIETLKTAPLPERKLQIRKLPSSLESTPISKANGELSF